MYDMSVEEQAAKLAQMEEELKEAQLEASNNKAAAEILTQMIADGDAVQDDSGAVKVSKTKYDSANVIGNLNDF